MNESAFYLMLERVLTALPLDLAKNEKLIQFLKTAKNQRNNISSMDYVISFKDLLQKDFKSIVTEPGYLFIQTGVIALSNYDNGAHFSIRDLTREKNFSYAPVGQSENEPIETVFTAGKNFTQPKDFFHLWGDRNYIEVQANNPGLLPNLNLYVIVTGFKINLIGL